ncbi:hypothetical protein T492DRAFT_1024009 [Pavlovales sp. CCMP2436]|nr:hypothetical protein T492DRAFT_1024009 [Pavlovales sp. CCMP2436]
MRAAVILLLGTLAATATQQGTTIAGLNLTVVMGDTRSCFADDGQQPSYLAYTAAVNLDWAMAHSYSFAFMELPCLENASTAGDGPCAACLHPQHGARHPSWCKLLAVYFALDALRTDLCLWMDSDAYFKTVALDASHIFRHSDRAATFFCNKPYMRQGKLNAGVLALRAPAARAFLTKWWNANPGKGAFNNRHDFEQRALSKDMRHFGAQTDMIRSEILSGKDELIDHVATFRSAQRVPLARAALERRGARLLSPADFEAPLPVSVAALANRQRTALVDYSLCSARAQVYVRHPAARPLARAQPGKLLPPAFLPLAGVRQAPAALAASARSRKDPEGEAGAPRKPPLPPPFSWPVALIWLPSAKTSARTRGGIDAIGRLRQLGVPRAQLLPAVNGADPAELRALLGGRDLEHLRCRIHAKLAAKRIGVWASHMRAVDGAVASGEPLLVLEQDFAVRDPEAFRSQLSWLAANLTARSDWDMVMLGNCLEKLSRISRCRCVAACAPLSRYSLWLGDAKKPGCTHALLFSARGLRKMAESAPMREWGVLYWNMTLGVEERTRHPPCEWLSQLRLKKQEWFRILNAGHDQLLRHMIATQELVTFEAWPQLVEQRAHVGHRSYDYGSLIPEACALGAAYAAVANERALRTRYSRVIL